MRSSGYLIYFAGCLFAIGWWCLIDAHAISGHHDVHDGGEITGADYVPGIISTIALVAVNMFSDRHFSRTESWSAQARLCVFVTFTLAFGGLIASAWIMFANYLIPRENVTVSEFKWGGVAIFLQNVLILVSTMMLRFGRSLELDSY